MKCSVLIKRANASHYAYLQITSFLPVIYHLCRSSECFIPSQSSDTAYTQSFPGGTQQGGLAASPPPPPAALTRYQQHPSHRGCCSPCPGDPIVHSQGALELSIMTRGARSAGAGHTQQDRAWAQAATPLLQGAEAAEKPSLGLAAGRGRGGSQVCRNPC